MVGDTPQAGGVESSSKPRAARLLLLPRRDEKATETQQPGKGEGIRARPWQVPICLPFLQLFLIQQGHWVEFAKGKAGAEAAGVVLARGRRVPAPARMLLVKRRDLSLKRSPVWAGTVHSCCRGQEICHLLLEP